MCTYVLAAAAGSSFIFLLHINTARRKYLTSTVDEVIFPLILSLFLPLSLSFSSLALSLPRHTDVSFLDQLQILRYKRRLPPLHPPHIQITPFPPMASTAPIAPDSPDSTDSV